MTPTTISRLDRAASILLWIWFGMALGFAVLTAPTLFGVLPRDQAGAVVARLLPRLDIAAWIAFGLSLLLVLVPRWLEEVQEETPIGPQRLWVAAALAALVVCLASSAIFTPKLRAIRADAGVAMETLAPDHPVRLAHQKVHAMSRQMMGLRMLLAMGLALTVGLLPAGRRPEA